MASVEPTPFRETATSKILRGVSRSTGTASDALETLRIDDDEIGAVAYFRIEGERTLLEVILRADRIQSAHLAD